MPQNDGYWFAAKRYGIGWTMPATWQGWLVLLVYLALLTGGLFLLSESPYRLPYILVITAALIAVIALKGEKPVRWRWGKD
ncbi:MAG: hypothetical protein PVG24_06475 [Gammaproteobacteria bacterium]|jgi:hypothetical protein